MSYLLLLYNWGSQSLLPTSAIFYEWSYILSSTRYRFTLKAYLHFPSSHSSNFFFIYNFCLPPFCFNHLHFRYLSYILLFHSLNCMPIPLWRKFLIWYRASFKFPFFSFIFSFSCSILLFCPSISNFIRCTLVLSSV